MATYYVNSGAGGTGSGADWTNAFTTYAAGVTAATAAGDVIKVHKAHTEELGAATTYTFLESVRTICVDKDSSDALATMAEAAWIGNSTTARTITLNGAFKVYIYGITFRGHGSAAAQAINNTDGGHFELESCKQWFSSTSASSNITLGSTANQYTKLVNHSIKHARTTAGNWTIFHGGMVDYVGGSIIAASTSTAPVFDQISTTAAPGQITLIGCDLSGIQASQTLVADMDRAVAEVKFVQCKLPTTPTVMGVQSSVPNKGSAHVWVFDSNAGDVHTSFGYYDAFGSVVSDTGIYFTAGAAAQSWKIVTTANCSFYTPFETPWVDYYNSTLSAQAPYIEILRDGSATAYQDDEVWLDVMAKTTTGFPISSLTTDRMTILGTPANQAAGAGTGSWTGENATAWSGKCAVASLTPAENGHIRARIVVGEPSITVYADPQIRT